MSGPLSGLGQQQQVSLTQPAQSVANDQSRVVRNDDQRPEENKIQARGAALAQAKESDLTNLETFKASLEDVKDGSEFVAEETPRGSLVDVVV
tara:strand:- start:185 stop:463 length:279 start_codon:yes stop_codon:yes gene_type:complete